MTKTIFVLNGPNLGLLGSREPHLYGHSTLADIESELSALACSAGFTLDFRQTDAEHEMLHHVHDARAGAAGIVINPAAFSYSSYSVLDALKMCDCPIIEVHLTNLHRRDEVWRAQSIMTRAVTGTIRVGKLLLDQPLPASGEWGNGLRGKARRS
ncbi:3-dehydroquinate dehydratase-2 [Sphingomonas vulcanisoli]|uniref:3-dehydroquinate dehydratase n=1 Tax=Sphingomonas vulcanisoli TaxID=1658060 RepID=A0ABX0TTV8_9SPHN|nr:type II 3-dehydroquinate dehydratase [Sphingomonas vulcanisoli]NIJ07594.1 3-dehydroquinate dehydratase-2 [Sphingomonas vulcanisoli]